METSQPSPIAPVKQIAYVAPSGYGKTTLLTMELLEYARANPDRPFYTNVFVYDGSGIKDLQHLHRQFRPLERFEQLKDLQNVMVGIDELGSKYVPSHQWTSPQNNLFVEVASNIRKHDVSLVWTDQNRTSVDWRLRNNVTHWFRPSLQSNGTISITRYENEQGFDNDNPKVKGLAYPGPRPRWFYDDEYDLYDVRLKARMIGLEPLMVDYDVQELEASDVKQVWQHFDTRQVIPKIPQFNLLETVESVVKWIQAEHEELSIKTLNLYQVEQNVTLTEKQRDAVFIKAKRMLKQ